ncbi:hypothetical protein [Streptomyces longispororuber]|uniref:hypothetical protein n=1 Tax=Streptomyces longispororuber TaxID=68230 RepID=UPI0036FB2572
MLVLKQPVFVGQELEVTDLREASIARDSGLDAVPAGSRRSVVGRPVAYTLPAGTLLTKSVLGSPKEPPAGRAAAAVGLKLGQFPTGLQPGHRVVVVSAADEEAAGGPAFQDQSWKAVVTGVRPDTDDDVTVVTLLLAEDDARRLAAAPEGALRVIVVPGGEER